MCVLRTITAVLLVLTTVTSVARKTIGKNTEQDDNNNSNRLCSKPYYSSLVLQPGHVALGKVT